MKLPFIIALCAGLVLSGAAQSGEMSINQRFSGVAHPTMVDANTDGAFANVISFQVKGSPGKATILAFGEFTPPAITACAPSGGGQTDLVQQSFVETFSDLSMLFFEVETGHTCFNIATSEITVELTGIITGGAGRFEGATGSWTTESEGFVVGPGVMIAFTGTITGTVEVPH